MLQRWTRQSCDIHQHITKQTALQTMTTHVLEGSALNLSCRLQVDHSYCHPRQTRIHLRVLKTNNNLINKQNNNDYESDNDDDDDDGTFEDD